MTKTCTAALRQNKIFLRLSDDNGTLLEERGGSYNSPSAAVSFFKNVLGRYGTQVRNIILAIDEPAQYYRLVSEQERSKEQLQAIWDIPDPAAVLHCRSGNRHIYYGLYYAKEIVDKYVYILKKLSNLDGSIVPLDFLYYQTQTPGFFVQRKNDQLVLKIFDGCGSYFYKILRVPNEQKALNKTLERLSIYTQREKILSKIPENILAEYQLNDCLTRVAQLEPENLLYTRGYYAGQKNIAKFTVWQKSLIFFISVLGLCLFLSASWQGYRIYSLSRQIRAEEKQYQQIAQRAQELQYVEADARDLRSRSRTESAAVRLILRQALANKILIKEIFYEQDKKLFYIIGLDRGNGRNLLISDLRRTELFSALNPIYFLPLDETTTEFKLLLTVK